MNQRSVVSPKTACTAGETGRVKLVRDSPRFRHRAPREYMCSLRFATPYTGFKRKKRLFFSLVRIFPKYFQGRNEVCGIRDNRGGIKDKKGGILDHNPGIRDHKP